MADGGAGKPGITSAVYKNGEKNPASFESSLVYKSIPVWQGKKCKTYKHKGGEKMSKTNIRRLKSSKKSCCPWVFLKKNLLFLVPGSGVCRLLPGRVRPGQAQIRSRVTRPPGGVGGGQNRPGREGRQVSII